MSCLTICIFLIFISSFQSFHFNLRNNYASLHIKQFTRLLLHSECTPTPLSCLNQSPSYAKNPYYAFLVGLAISFNVFTLFPTAAIAEDSWDDRNRLTAEVWRAIDEMYYDRTFNKQDWFKLRQDLVNRKFKDDAETYKAIKDMVDKLGDRYTRYLPPAQYQSILNSALGELTGVGLELLAQEDGSTRVVNVQENSPAAEAGLLQGDLILDVDGSSTTGISPEEVAALLRGKEGTKATVRVNRGGKQLDFTAIRKPLRLKAVLWSKEQINGQKVGIIAVRTFSSSTCDDVSTAIEDMNKDGNKVDQLVLDLRNNGGGLLQGAVQTANVFLPPGKIVVFVVSKEGVTDAQRTLPGTLTSTSTLLPDLTTPLVVLVNSNSASAAEVLAAALQENGRAKLVGEKTFGKGIIQTLRELRQGGLAVTVSKYETPLHHNINKVGIPVDIPVECAATATAATCLSSTL